jgi:hypothetical protein
MLHALTRQLYCHRRSLFAKAAASAEPYSPRLAYTTACAEWLERFNTDCTTESPLFSLDDVMLVGDMYYLPFELGERATAYLQTSTAVITHRESAKLTEFQTESDAIQCVYVKLTSMHHRELCYTLYRYLWDAKEEADVLSRFASWLHASSEADGKCCAEVHRDVRFLYVIPVITQAWWVLDRPMQSLDRFEVDSWRLLSASSYSTMTRDCFACLAAWCRTPCIVC